MRNGQKTASPRTDLTTAVLLQPMSPHTKVTAGYSGMTFDLLLALLPTAVFGVLSFGLRAALLLLLSVAAAMLSECLLQLLLSRPVRLADGTAAVTGLLLGLSLSPAVPLWLPPLGACFAIVVAKQPFGGTGRNFLNPALSARLFLSLCFPLEMSRYTAASVRLPVFQVSPGADLVTSATPLSAVLSGDLDASPLPALFPWRTIGCIGETSVLLLLAGGAYLLLRRVIRWEIPAAYLGVFALMSYAFPLTDRAQALPFMLESLLTGGVMLAAFFMATDPVTTPLCRTGRLLFGAGCGFLTVLLRYFAPGGEGVTCAILLMNLLTGPLDRLSTASIRKRRSL